LLDDAYKKEEQRHTETMTTLNAIATSMKELTDSQQESREAELERRACDAEMQLTLLTAVLGNKKDN
jgi:hypothetical protein